MARKKKEPEIQAEIVNSFLRLSEELTEAAGDAEEIPGGFLEMTETHIIFLEALAASDAAKAEAVYNTMNELNETFKSLAEKNGTEKEKVYGNKQYDKLKVNAEEGARLEKLSNKINDYIDEGKEQYIKLYAADKEKLKADAQRAILAERFEDFAIYRAYQIISYAEAQKEGKAADQKAEQKAKAARVYDGLKMLDYYLKEEIAGNFWDIWTINNKGTAARKEWAKNAEEAKEKLLKEWLGKVAKEDLEGTGLLKEEKKEQPEQVERVPIINTPDKLKFLVSNAADNLIQSNLDFLKLPVDGQQKFVLDTDGEKGQRITERPGKYKDAWGKTHIGKTVYSRIYMTAGKGVTLDKELLKVDDTDINLFTHLITLLAYGNHEMTSEQLYQQYTHSKTPITKKWEDRIDLFFRKFSNRRLGIIYDELVAAGMIPETKENKMYLNKGSWEEQILVYGKKPYINKHGKQGWKYVIRDMPFIYIYSEWRDEILSVDMQLLNAGTNEKSNTEDAINIKHYLLLRISKAKRKKAKKTLTPSDTTILISTLIDRSLSPFDIIDRGQGKPREIKPKEITRQRKSEVLKIIKAILQDLKDHKEIKAFDIPKEKEGKGGKIERVTFEV